MARFPGGGGGVSAPCVHLCTSRCEDCLSRKESFRLLCGLNISGPVPAVETGCGCGPNNSSALTTISSELFFMSLTFLTYLSCSVSNSVTSPSLGLLYSSSSIPCMVSMHVSSASVIFLTIMSTLSNVSINVAASLTFLVLAGEIT